MIKGLAFCYSLDALFFDNLATAKFVAHHPVNPRDEHRRRAWKVPTHGVSYSEEQFISI